MSPDGHTAKELLFLASKYSFPSPPRLFPVGCRANRREWVCSGTTSSIAMEKSRLLIEWNDGLTSSSCMSLHICRPYWNQGSCLVTHECDIEPSPLTSIDQRGSKREAEQQIWKVSSPRKLILPGKRLLTTFASTSERFVVGMLGHIVSIEMKGRFEC